MSCSRYLTAAALLLLIILSGCARPPLQKLDAASYLLDRAHTLQAVELAPTEYQSALTALNEAKASLEARDYRNAEASLDFSLLHTRRAIALTEQLKSNQRAKEAEAKRIAEEAARQSEERKQQALLEEKRAAEAASKAAREASPKPTHAPKLQPIYKVGSGENLWTISAQPTVYDDGFLWPLLYQANRDQIKDPRQIYPGQVLNIRRDLTEQEMAEARQKARESNIFPPPPSP